MFRPISESTRRALLTGAASSLALIGLVGTGSAQAPGPGGYDDSRLYKDQFGQLYRKRGGQYVPYAGRVVNGRPIDDGAPPGSAAIDGSAGPSAPPPKQAGYPVPPQKPDDAPIDYARIYGPIGGEPFPVAPIAYQKFNQNFLRKEVDYPSREPPGTIVVDPRARFLYLVLPNGRARRYGVGVGKQGFAWSGAATINSKQAWPDWYPPMEMMARRPDLRGEVSKLQSGVGVPGGPRNPLGARAMYLWQNNKDTLFRIHGTTEPYTIGQSVSSGCIRMINQDAIDLFNRVDVGTRVVVL